MCGIAGYIGFNKINEEIIHKSLAAMYQRGPDYQSSAHLESGNINVHLLHARLSIIDLDPRSHQPFKLAHIVLVFNGEIYNYVELKERIIKEGIVLIPIPIQKF